MQNKLLYDLEYKVNELRKDYVKRVQYEDLTLKDVLDLGFDRTNIEINNHYIYFYKDLEGNYICDNYYCKNEDLLNKKVIYVCDYLNDNNYLNVDIKFKNDEDLQLLNDYLETL